MTKISPKRGQQVEARLRKNKTKRSDASLANAIAAKNMGAGRNKTKIFPPDLSDVSREGDLIKVFGSRARLDAFKELANAYESKPTLESYLRIRSEFVNVEMSAGVFGSADPLLILATELKKHNVEDDIVVAALAGYEPAMDELSLKLMQLLVGREKLPRKGPGHIDLRRRAISDSVVNFCIALMLEATGRSTPKVAVPSSLIVLIRNQLCGPVPDLHQAYLSKELRERAAICAAERFGPDEKISVRQFSKVTGVKRSTAARWLLENDFRQSIKEFRALLNLLAASKFAQK